ncbi:DnaJ-domain-containing protein [Dothidotthia symphoricarpi CBS 119687]|uniref:DnaJ-domain-containing protein n=1 Tax=Dothidotthia symphoricarpi CBS 119687 TaxID=1392245 RepID=A0A6A5ZUY0_9PLEO|nr:DnaJ-domain-containing protein [Dothidotthia symphoricarpi CBS 119687]KAF2123532.1 DnaJ-domain-containing protein [Dothidotthia symphoricarpi CBS 119687]
MTRSQARVGHQTTTNKPSLRKRDRNSKTAEFNVYVDPQTENGLPTPPLKKPKRISRSPLSVRTGSPNISPAPSPLGPDTPFPYSPADPFWCDKENYDRRTYYLTPPSTPVARRPSTVSADTPAPKNMTLYSLLGLNDSKASDKKIRMAYKKMAMKYHPDRADQEERCAATLRMQRVNAARDVLLDQKRRKAYHQNGQLPWSM